jgi:hypothetical protein
VVVEGVNGLPFAFSADGSQLAGSGGWGHLPVVWDAVTGKARQLEDKTPYRDWPTPEGKSKQQLGFCGEPAAATFSEDGKNLFVEGQSTFQGVPGGSVVTAWDLSKGTLIADVRVGCSLDKAEIPYSWLHLRGAPVPGSAVTTNRFRVSQRGLLLVLPRYNAIPYAPRWDSFGSFTLVTVPPVAAHSPDPPKVLWKCDDFRGSTYRACYLSPDGKWLVATGMHPKRLKEIDSPCLLVLWDVCQFRAAATAKIPEPTAKELEAYWSWLAEPEDEWNYQTTVRARRAMIALQAHPAKLVPFLLERMGKASCDPKRIWQWIDDLDDVKFSVRDKAFAELDQLGGEALPHVEKALAGKNSLEKAARLEQLRQRMRKKEAPGEVRALRILDVLEHCDAPAARKLLQGIADGEYWPAYAPEAQAALKRAAKQAAK